MKPIGVFLIARLACRVRHLPGCYNAQLRQTWCICGQQRWDGNVGTWHSTARYEPAPATPPLGIGVGAVGMREPERKLIGWDTFFMHTDDCPQRLEPDDEAHICGGSTSEPIVPNVVGAQGDLWDNRPTIKATPSGASTPDAGGLAHPSDRRTKRPW